MIKGLHRLRTTVSQANILSTRKVIADDSQTQSKHGFQLLWCLKESGMVALVVTSCVYCTSMSLYIFRLYVPLYISVVFIFLVGLWFICRLLFVCAIFSNNSVFTSACAGYLSSLFFRLLPVSYHRVRAVIPIKFGGQTESSVQSSEFIFAAFWEVSFSSITYVRPVQAE